MKYEARTFNLPELKGLSKKQIDLHLSLYEGYVKHANLIMEKLEEMREKDAEGNAYAMAEIRRRFGFEFDGMRMHEYYFEQFEGEKGGNPESGLAKAAAERYGSGWVVVYWDQVGKTLHTAWVNDHEIGQLGGCPVIVALDLWEHAYMVDYLPSQKKDYIDAFFDNFNWTVAEARFDKASA
jgi:Fe-Mn family superoxide dismutase